MARGSTNTSGPPSAGDHDGPAPAPTRIVAIGASAGGLEALQAFLGAIDEDSGSAFIVAQHLAPSHPSRIVELLARACRLEVVEAVDGAPLRAGRVVVAPPDRDVTVVDGAIRVRVPTERFGPSPSIDALLESVAALGGDRVTGVILSGTGSDGAHGLRAVRGAGGLTMVQRPDTAAFDGMPRAAIALGGAELVDEPESLGLRLGELEAGFDAPTDGPPKATSLGAVLAQFRRSVGVDVSGY